MDKQKKERIVLSYDVGTQSARAHLVNSRGDILMKKQITYEPAFFAEKPGYAEQDPDMYYRCMCACSKAIKEEMPEAFDAVEAVTVSTIRDTSVCVDREGKPLRPAMVWMDKRLAKGSPKFNPVVKAALKAMGIADFLTLQYRKSQCNWIMEEQPEIWEKTYKYLMLSGYLTYRLTGRFADAAASLVGHIPFNNQKRTWRSRSDVLLPVFTIPEDKLPEVVETGEVIGRISARVSEETGLKEGLPVYPSGADKACEVIGMGCMKKEQVAVSFGTMATIDFTSPDYYEMTKIMPPFPSVIPGHYAPEYELYRGYWLVSWFEKEFAEIERAEAASSGKSALELLNAKLPTIPPGCEGLMFQPYFMPSVYMPYAKGGFTGMSDHHTRLHMYRAIIEGINYSLMEGVSMAEKAGKFKIREIRIGGGGSQSPEICQITANMFGVPVVRVHTHEVTGIGSAMAAFVALGEFASFDEAAEKMVHEKDRFLPDESEHRFYREIYENVWKEIFGKLSPLYGKTQEIYSKFDRQS